MKVVLEKEYDNSDFYFSNYFKDKYDKSAVKVSDNKESGGGAGERFRRGASLTPAKLPVSKRSLVYIQPSPDYCSDDPQVTYA